MNGLMYKEVSSFVGTQSFSHFTNASTASINISSGTPGIQILLFELIILLAFISGLNNNISPFSFLYAFKPSKVSCA